MAASSTTTPSVRQSSGRSWDQRLWPRLRSTACHHRALGWPLARINPNVLTFMGLVVNTWAAILFGFCPPPRKSEADVFSTPDWSSSFTGFFDLVDGEVARATNRRPPASEHFSILWSTATSDASQFLGLLVYYGPQRPFLLCRAHCLRHGKRHHGQLHPRPRRIADRILPRGLSWNALNASCS